MSESRVLILIKSNGAALRGKWVQYTAVKNAFHLACTIEGAVLKIAVMECTVREDCLIERYAIELAVCNPYGVDIGPAEGTVSERATRKTGPLQISVIENNFIKNALDKNGTVEQRIIKASVFPTFMLYNLEAEITVWCQVKVRLVFFYFIHGSLPHLDSTGTSQR